MAHDRMMNDDLDRNMGGQEDIGKQDFGRQTPGRNPQQGQETGQKGAGQKGQDKPSQAEGEDSDDFNQGGGSNPNRGPGRAV
ncbi:MAG TPA: hypothetical protein VFS76_22070 [Pyrinomonadaceae bacterium]|nr:hypothetical protein [Pyrinomonadaceae bacterium]